MRNTMIPSSMVDMTAPSSASTYNSAWALADGNTDYCYLPVTITVK